MQQKNQRYSKNCLRAFEWFSFEVLMEKVKKEMVKIIVFDFYDESILLAWLGTFGLPRLTYKELNHSFQLD